MRSCARGGGRLLVLAGGKSKSAPGNGNSVSGNRRRRPSFLNTVVLLSAQSQLFHRLAILLTLRTRAALGRLCLVLGFLFICRQSHDKSVLISTNPDVRHQLINRFEVFGPRSFTSLAVSRCIISTTIGDWRQRGIALLCMYVIRGTRVSNQTAALKERSDVHE